MFIFYVLNILLALYGAYAAWTIFNHKAIKKEVLVCQIGFDCNAVVNSKYGKILGIENSLLGLGYYAVTVIIYGHLLAGVNPMILGYKLSLLAIIPAIGGIFFSFYLMIIMDFVLKEYCSWCLDSATISIAIGVISLMLQI